HVTRADPGLGVRRYSFGYLQPWSGDVRADHRPATVRSVVLAGFDREDPDRPTDPPKQVCDHGSPRAGKRDSADASEKARTTFRQPHRARQGLGSDPLQHGAFLTASLA